MSNILDIPLKDEDAEWERRHLDMPQSHVVYRLRVALDKNEQLVKENDNLKAQLKDNNNE